MVKLLSDKLQNAVKMFSFSEHYFGMRYMQVRDMFVTKQLNERHLIRSTAAKLQQSYDFPTLAVSKINMWLTNELFELTQTGSLCKIDKKLFS